MDIVQGVSKKIVHSDFCLMCALKVQFHFFICDLESEFGACFIKILKPYILWILIALKMHIIACVGIQFSLITYDIANCYLYTVSSKAKATKQRALHINDNSQHRRGMSQWNRLKILILKHMLKSKIWLLEQK